MKVKPLSPLKAVTDDKTQYNFDTLKNFVTLLLQYVQELEQRVYDLENP